MALKQDGMTPAFTSSCYGRKDCLELLLEHKADVNKADEVSTLVFVCVLPMSWRSSCSFIFNFFLVGNRSDEYEIHRCCVMCAAVYNELLRRSCKGVCSGKGGETKK